jgi:hypothetical protein
MGPSNNYHHLEAKHAAIHSQEMTVKINKQYAELNLPKNSCVYLRPQFLLVICSCCTKACPSEEPQQSTAVAESCRSFGSGTADFSTLLTMAEQSTSSSLAWISWNETFFFAGSWEGSGGFAGGGQASLDPNPNLQFLGEGIRVFRVRYMTIFVWAVAEAVPVDVPHCCYRWYFLSLKQLDGSVIANHYQPCISSNYSCVHLVMVGHEVRPRIFLR